MFNPNEHLMDLKGKKYLQIMWRLVWFRDEKPLWSIDTKLEQLTENHAVFCAKIYDENGVQKSAGYGSESIKDFRDYIEKAETKAVGRALAMLGYGTQFSPELDEGERIADSPVNMNRSSRPAIPSGSAAICSECKKEITAAENDYSIKRFNRALCRKCQGGQKRYGGLDG